MAKPRDYQSETRGGPSSPQELPNTNPPRVTMDHSFTLQAVHDLQHKVGALEVKIDNVKEILTEIREEFKEAKKSIQKFEKVLFAAGVVLSMLVVIGGWIVNKSWDLMMDRMKQEATHTQPISAPAPVEPAPPSPKPAK